MFWSRSIDPDDSGPARRGPWLPIALVLTSGSALTTVIYLDPVQAWSVPLALAAACLAVAALVFDARR